MSAERERIARLVRLHWYDTEDMTCGCISSNVASEADITHMSIVAHSEHVADTILHPTRGDQP